MGFTEINELYQYKWGQNQMQNLHRNIVKNHSPVAELESGRLNLVPGNTLASCVSLGKSFGVGSNKGFRHEK